MPSQTYHLQRKHMEYLDELCDEYPEMFENPSQALKYVIAEYQELEQANRRLAGAEPKAVPEDAKRDDNGEAVFDNE